MEVLQRFSYNISLTPSWLEVKSSGFSGDIYDLTDEVEIGDKLWLKVFIKLIDEDSSTCHFCFWPASQVIDMKRDFHIFWTQSKVFFKFFCERMLKKSEFERDIIFNISRFFFRADSLCSQIWSKFHDSVVDHRSRDSEVRKEKWSVKLSIDKLFSVIERYI